MRIRCFSAFEPGWSYYRDLLPYLVRHGHDVEILITDSSYRDQRGGSFASLMRQQGVRVNVVNAGGGGGAGRGRARVRVYVSYILAAMGRSLFGRAVDANLFLTQPPFFFLWGLVLRILRGQKYMVVLMDLYPDVVFESGMARRGAPHIRLSAWLTRLGHRSADALIAIGRCTRARMIRDGVHPERIHVAPNWSNDSVHPIERLDNPLREELGIGNRFVVMYSGNMGVSHYFDDIIEVARRFRGDDNIRFVFAGDGARRQELEQARARAGLHNVMLLPFQPIERLAYSLALGDVHFVSLRSRFEALVVPSKTYSVLNAGRGIIYQGEADGEIARMIGEEDIGVVVPDASPDALEAAIREAVTNSELVRGWGERARALARSTYSREKALARYAAAFADLEANAAISRGPAVSSGATRRRKAVSTAAE